MIRLVLLAILFLKHCYPNAIRYQTAMAVANDGRVEGTGKYTISPERTCRIRKETTAPSPHLLSDLSGRNKVEVVLEGVVVEKGFQ